MNASASSSASNSSSVEAMNAPTKAVGVSLADSGALVVRYMDMNDDLREVDITENVANIAQSVYDSALQRAQLGLGIPGNIVSAPTTRTMQ